MYYDTKDEITIDRIRVDQTLYMNFKNDVSYKAGDKFLIFAEHQSTINPNMCIRSLMYAGRAYEQMIPVRSRYSSKKTEIPLPEFYVFYNGMEDYPEETVIKLSDSYKIKTDDPLLELKVKVININLNKNHELLKKCPVLHEYMQFIDAVREQRKTGERESIRKAVEHCIRKDILKGYLSRKASEVRNMLIAEYDYEMDIAVKVEEAVEDAVKEVTEEVTREVTKKVRTADIKLYIHALKRLGLSMDEIASNLRLDFSLTDDELKDVINF